MSAAKSQRRDALRLFGFTLCVTSSYMICRIVADAMFLARLGTAALPPMLFVSAVVVGAVSMTWARRTRLLSLQRLIVLTQLSAALATVVLLLLMRSETYPTLVICLLYVLAELRGCFNIIQLAVLLNEKFCSRTEQQNFAFVNAGSPVAGMIVGITIVEADWIPPGLLLVMSCILDVCAVAIVHSTTRGVRIRHSVRRLGSHVPPTVVKPSSATLPDAESHSRTFTRAILWLVVCKTVVLTIVGFEWKVFAYEVFPDERALATYFGLFYAISDGLILLIQIFVARILLGRVGVSACILFLPIYLTVLGIISLTTQNVWILFCVLTAARGSMVIRRGIHDVAVQILYGTLPKTSRRETVARVLGMAKPVAEAVAAGGIGILAVYLPVRTFSWFWLPVMIVWLWWTADVVKAWSHLNFSSAPVGETLPDAATGE